MLNSFYLKDNKANLVLNVQTTGEVKAKDLFQMGAISLELLDEFCKDQSLNYNSDDLNLKLDVQSPGFILLTGVSMGAVVILGIILVAIAGGGFTFSSTKAVTKATMQSDGIIEKVRKFLNSSSNRKAKKQLLEKHMKNLDIKDPEELVKILKELDN